MPYKGDTFAPPTVDELNQLHTINTWIKAESVTLGIKNVDLYTLMGGEGGDPDVLLAAYDSGDHVHTSQGGANFMAQQFYLDTQFLVISSQKN